VNLLNFFSSNVLVVYSPLRIFLLEWAHLTPKIFTKTDMLLFQGHDYVFKSSKLSFQYCVYVGNMLQRRLFKFQQSLLYVRYLNLDYILPAKNKAFNLFEALIVRAKFFP